MKNLSFQVCQCETPLQSKNLRYEEERCYLLESLNLRLCAYCKMTEQPRPANQPPMPNKETLSGVPFYHL